jgi:cytidylate kinase
MEGRDIGTAVFPDAGIKFFLDASHEVRAQRRGLELQAKGAGARPLQAEDACPRVLKAGVSNDMKERDRRDMERQNSPLVKADDAIFIDTGLLSIEGVVEKIMGIIRQRNIIADICS